MGASLLAAGGGLPPAPIRLLPARSQPVRKVVVTLPRGRVREWVVTLRTLPDQDVALTPSPSGIHSLTSSWLHSNALDPSGEPHHGDHGYAVRWRCVGPETLTVTLRLFREELSSVLVRRVFEGRAERLGRVALLVTGLRDGGVTELGELVAQPHRRWRLRFPAGVTFKRGDVFMPWPSPEAVLHGIHRRLGQLWGWDLDPAVLRRAIRGIATTQVDLTTRSWREGRGGRGRDVALAVGSLDWATDGDPEIRTLTDLLLQAGTLTGVGAKTTWGAGTLEVNPRVVQR